MEELVSFKQAKMVSTSLLLSRLILPLLLTCFASMSSATTFTTLKRQPGFIYSRTRGRCTPQFWSSSSEAWPRMVPQTSTVMKVFGSRAFERYGSNMTLLEATGMSEEDSNACNKLVKEASATLLNSYGRKGFPYSAWEVKTLMIQGLVSEDAAAHLTQRFSIANDACI